VLFLTTVFTGDERVNQKRKKPSSKKSEAKPIQRSFGDEAVKVTNIPTVAAAYNDEMNHVDQGDQLRSYYAYDHPLRRALGRHFAGPSFLMWPLSIASAHHMSVKSTLTSKLI